MRKNLKITEDAHRIIKDFCEANHLKMSDWASSVLLRETENGTTKETKIKKKLSSM
jgi:hypothetical protein